MSINSFSVAEVRTWRDPRPKASKSFITNYPATCFPIGLNLIDTKAGFNARVKAYVDNVTPLDDTFQNFKADFHLDTWRDSCLYSAKCTWLDVSKHSTDFQFGSFTTGQLSRETDIVRDIQFDKWHYTTEPRVVVWLSALDIDHTHNPRIFASATNVTTSGFKLHIGTWLDSIVNECTVHWVAMPPDRSNITAGNVRFNAGKSGSKSALTQRVIFDKAFERPPRVLVALNVIDAWNGKNLRIIATTKNISKGGMELIVSAWSGSILYGAGVSYIAIEDLIDGWSIMSGDCFHTVELGPTRNPRPLNFKSIITNHPAWHFPIGINRIDTKGGANSRIRAYIDNVAAADSTFHRFKADVHLDTWLDTSLNEARCTWLDISKHSSDIQFGFIETGRLVKGADVVQDIQFDRWQYASTPKVIVWLSAFDLSHTDTARISTWVDNITTSGFKLHANTWFGSIVYESTVHWIAIPSNRPNMTAGAVAWGADKTEKAYFSKEVVFDVTFERPPRVLLALKFIDAGPKNNLRISATVKDVTKSKMTVVVSSWAGSLHYATGVSYLAIEDPQLGESFEGGDMPSKRVTPDFTIIVERNIAN